MLLLFLSFYLPESLCSDNSILIIDNTVYLKRAKCAYPLAWSVMKDCKNANTNQWVNVTHLTFGLHLNGDGQYVLRLSYDVVVAIFFYERNARSKLLCSLYLIFIDEMDKLSQNITENRPNLRLLRRVHIWSSKYAVYY